MRAVLFDLDDTLLDLAGASEGALCAHVSEVAGDAVVGGSAPMLTHWRALERRHFARFESGELSLHEQRRARTRDFCRHFGLPLGTGQAAADEWFAGFLSHCEARLAAFPDVAPALDALARLGLRLGVVSNGQRANQERKLRLCGLDGRFDCVVCREGQDSAAKPDPRIFRAACAHLGLAPGEVAYVGDRLDSDARAARAAGLVGVWLDRSGRGLAAGVPVVVSLGELPALLADLRHADGHGPAWAAAATRPAGRVTGPPGDTLGSSSAPTAAGAASLPPAAGSARR